MLPSPSLPAARRLMQATKQVADFQLPPDVQAAVDNAKGQGQGQGQGQGKVRSLAIVGACPPPPPGLPPASAPPIPVI